MANKKTKNQFDALRGDIAALTEAIWALREQVTVEIAASQSSATNHSPARGDGPSGFEGLGAEGDPLSTDLMSVDEDDAARILSALGHRQRLAIVKQLVRRPSSAAELVEELNLGTTGAAYHHLNVLLAADLVVQQSRGVYAVDDSRVTGLLTLLAGVAATVAPAMSPNRLPLDAMDDALLAQTTSI